MSLSFQVALLPSLARFGEHSHQIAVVIDTLRFTTTATTALTHGAKAIVTFREAEACREARQTEFADALLCGERHGHRIAGFDLGNSPAEYGSEQVRDKTLLFSTTNGTTAIQACTAANQVWLGCFLNRHAISRQISQQIAAARKRHENLAVTLVCAGTDGQVTAEDVWTAGSILHDLSSRAGDWPPSFSSRLNDAAQIALDSWQSLLGRGPSNHLTQELRRAIGGKNLVEAGYGDDLTLAAEIDSIDLVAERVSSQPSESPASRAIFQAKLEVDRP